MFDTSIYENNIVMVGIRKKDPSGRELVNVRGTGFILRDKSLVTCHHVLSNIPAIHKDNIVCWAPVAKDKSIIKYKLFNITHVDSDGKNDVTLFNIDMGDGDKMLGKGLEIDDLVGEGDIEKLKSGMDIHFVGYPLANELMNMGMGITQTTSKAIISSIKFRSEDGKLNFILIDKLINPGSSGSPVFIEITKGKYKILGIASGTLNQGHKIGETLINIPVSIGMLRPSNYIRGLLNK